MAAPMAGTGRLAARRKARLLPTGRVAHGLAQRSRAVHPLPPPRLETEQRSSPPPLPPPCAVRPTRRHSAPRHCSTWGPTAASAAAAAAGPTAAAPFQIRLGRAGPKTARRRPASNYDPRRPGPTLTAPTGGDPHLRCGDPQLPFHPDVVLEASVDEQQVITRTVLELSGLVAQELTLHLFKDEAD